MFEPERPIIRNPDAEDERARDLEARLLNGLDRVIVFLGPPAGSDEARLDLHFVNSLHVADILAEILADPARAAALFRVHGGRRIRGGLAPGEVRCTAVVAAAEPHRLTLTLAPIGDYSSYRLELLFDPARVDPFFAELRFKFRPGCFTNDCDPPPRRVAPAAAAPRIDYLAKDYESFRHTLTTAMAERVPGWAVSSEADLDQVLIDTVAAAADELSDYQDRVMNEAYLATARTRVSLARHARLMDYHIHQGAHASTWLALTLTDTAPPFRLAATELTAWSGHADAPADWIWFASHETTLAPDERAELSPLQNALALHTWSDARPALAVGATRADVVSTVLGAGQPEAEALATRINDGRLRRLVLAEVRDPQTGRETGADPSQRQLLTLRRNAVAARDPLEDRWLVQISWRDEDRLTRDYSFVTQCPDGRVDGVSAFFGNLLEVGEGRLMETYFLEPDTPLPEDTPTRTHRHFARRRLYGEPRGVLAELPDGGLAYRQTPPGGIVPPHSTLRVEVEPPGAGADAWDERISLVQSDESAENGDHFVVETDELSRSVIRFGDGVNGRTPPVASTIRTRWQQGGGIRGNVGAGTLTAFAAPADAPPDAILSVWNPFDVVNGRDPEPPDVIRRAAPEAYRARQLRAVTLADYRRRAEEVPGVSRAVASYAWTGSWQTVRIAVDPAGTTTLSPTLSGALSDHLSAVRLIGEDLEIRPPRFVPVVVEIALCVHPDYWPLDVRAVLEEEFSDARTADGRPGFFNPDHWTFGQPLRRSAIAGRLHAVAGVAHAIEMRMRRFETADPDGPPPEVLPAAFDEIFMAMNDPDHLERGSVAFDLRGGRQ